MMTRARAILTGFYIRHIRKQKFIKNKNVLAKIAMTNQIYRNDAGIAIGFDEKPTCRFSTAKNERIYIEALLNDTSAQPKSLAHNLLSVSLLNKGYPHFPRIVIRLAPH